MLNKFVNFFNPFYQNTVGISINPFGVIRLMLTFVLIIVVSSFWPIHSVPTGYLGVVTTLGKIDDVRTDGGTWVWPWQKLTLFNARAESATIENAEGSTSDTQPVKVSLTVRYAINRNKVAEVFEQYSRDGDLSSYVQTATQEVFKAVTARYSAPDLISKRKNVSDDILSALAVKLGTYGARVISIDMRTFSFSGSYMEAINEKVTQEQKRLAAENKLKTVESEQKQKVAIAEAEANAAQKTADGQAYVVTKAAEAEAQAIRVKAQALAQNKDLLELRRIEVEATRAEKWDGKLPTTMYGSAPIPFLNAK
jgi:regulator of protease activity HflC (stomatin/prohibitin superfamily)